MKRNKKHPLKHKEVRPGRSFFNRSSLARAANVSYWHISEVTNGASDFRLGEQSGLNANVAVTAAYDPKETLGWVEILHCGGLLPC